MFLSGRIISGSSVESGHVFKGDSQTAGQDATKLEEKINAAGGRRPETNVDPTSQ